MIFGVFIKEKILNNSVIPLSEKIKLICFIAGTTSSATSFSETTNVAEELIEEVVLVVSPRIVARDRVESVEPILSYDIEFFQRFEPSNLNDMLKRVPGLNIDTLFSSTRNFSDTEANDFGFRGLFGEGAGQILINGRRIPGINIENSISFSGIPAELVKKIEIHRISTARMDSQGVGLTVNVVLKDGSDIPSTKNAIVRANVRKIGDENAGAISGSFKKSTSGGTDLSLSYSFDNGKRNSIRTIEDTLFMLDGDGNVSSSDFTLNRQQDDTIVDKTQIGLNFTLDKEYDNEATFSAHAYYFDNEREDRSETIFTESNSPDIQTRREGNDEDQTNIGTALSASFPLFGEPENRLTFDLSYDESSFDFVLASSFLNTTELDLDQAQDLERSEVKFESRFDFRSNTYYDLTLGLHSELNQLDITSNFSEDDRDIEQSRLDFFGIYTIHPNENFSIDFGYRYETTTNESLMSKESTQTDNPSTHIRWKVADNHDLRLSAARNTSRPVTFDARLLQTGFTEFSITDTEQEKYTSVELDYEYHFAQRKGITGLSLFHKKADNASENVVITGEDEVRNYITNNQANFLPALDAAVQGGSPIDSLDLTIPGNGEVSVDGAELDFSIPMSIIGLPELSFSSNISYFERQFDDNDPVDSVSANFTLDHKIGSFSYGISTNIKSDETIRRRFLNSNISGEVLVFDRDPSVDVFIEKRFENSFVVRLVAENISDASDGFSSTINLVDQSNPRFVSSDRTESDPNVQLILRGTF